MNKTDKKLVIGRLGDALGIKGWLHLFSDTAPPNNIFEYPNWFILKNQKPVFIHYETYKQHGNHFSVKLKDCDDRDQALLLKNQDIYIDRADLPTLNNEFYWDDLVGLTVVDTTGKILGIVQHLFSNGANDMLAVKNEKTHYIPYLAHVILEVHLEKKEIVVDWEII